MAIGVFDGVHLGHRAVIREAVRRARRLKGNAVVLTFHPHPAKILIPELTPPLLTTEQQDDELFSNLDVDICLTLDFTPEFSRRTARNFLKDLSGLTPALKAVVVGVDWHFGCDREGDFDLLREWGAKHRVETVEVPAVEVEDLVVSSTLLRHLVAAGRISAVNARLGRPYQLMGRVVKGLGLATKLGFPTANLEVENELIPAAGVYAGRVLVEGTVFAAAVNIGPRPMPKAPNAVLVEAHLLDFVGRLHGHHVRLDFLKRLRDRKHFDHVAKLRQQIHQDIVEVHHLAHS